MSHETLVMYFIIVLAAVGMACLILAFTDKKKPSPSYPSAGCTTMQYYDADYIIIAGEIENARNIYHLEIISEEIKDFKRRYRDYQEPVVLQIDTNRLRRLWKEKKTSFEVRIAIFS